MKIRYFRILIVLLLIALFAVGCDDDNDPTPQPSKSSNDGANPQPQLTAADLQILEVSVGPANDSTNTFTHELVLTVRNHGGTDASGFNVNCGWSCAGGSVTSYSQDLIYDAFVQGGGQFTYRQPFRDPCEISFGSVPMTCEVDSNNSIAESNENNNQWQGTGNFN